MSGMQANRQVRFTTKQNDAIKSLGPAIGGTDADAIRDMIPTGADLRVVLHEIENQRIGRPIVTHLLAGYVRDLIRRFPNDRPIDEQVLRDLAESDPSRTIAFFFGWAEASGETIIDESRGVQHRLCQFPRGGRWEKLGYTGWTVVSEGQRLTKDGTEQIA